METIAEPDHDDEARRAATMKRLDFLIDWYRRHAEQERLVYRVLKVLSIGTAAAVSVSAAASNPQVVTATLGALIVVFETIQSVFHLHADSVSYAQTKELLIREKALYDARAGGYARSSNPDRYLAEQVERIAAAELSSWVDKQTDEKAA